MRSISIVALLTALCFAFAGSVRAGDFGAPVGDNACGELDIAGSAMSDPTTKFVSAETPRLCQKLCERAGKLCRVYVNDAFVCHLRLYGNLRSFGKLNCDSALSEPAEVKACKQQTNEVADTLIDIVKAQTEDSREDCTDWRDACRASCTP